MPPERFGRPAATPLRRSVNRLVTFALITTLPALVACSSAPAKSTVPSAATHAVRRFLTDYVDREGRVVRHDQGGDTVSEGQGYALLLSVAIGDRQTFDRVWQWTRRHLQQPSHLFAYHWRNGSIADPMPASDADVQIAWAVALAATRFHHSQWAEAAREIATSVAQHEIGYDDTGAPVLAAGPWAVGAGRATVVEPGYWTPPAVRALADLTGDNRWRDLRAGELRHLDALTRGGRALPPDWAQVGAGAGVAPVPAPDGTAGVQSGPDALRTLVWTTCTPAGRSLAAKWWPLLAGTARGAPLARALDGRPLRTDSSALSAVAAAAVAKAAGQPAVAAGLLARAARIDAQYPTYYGAAWVALGRVLLTTDRLAQC
jgi:endoglucanase